MERERVQSQRRFQYQAIRSVATMLLTLLLAILSTGVWAPTWATPKPSGTIANSGAPLKLKLSPAPKPKANAAQPTLPKQLDLYGLVLSVENTQTTAPRALFNPEQRPKTLQKVTVRLEAPSHKLGLKSDRITVDNALGDNPAYNIPLRPGSRILLNAEKDDHANQWRFYIADRDRTPGLMILGTLTLMAILLIGGPEVAKHTFLVILILWGCYSTLFPVILSQGTGPQWTFLMCAVFTIFATFIYQQPGTRHFSREQLVVLLSTWGGLIILSLILWLMHEIAPLDGYSSEALASLWHRSPKMDYWSFFMAGMLFAFQGFLFYLCWTLAQTRKDSEPLSFQQRFDLIMMRGRRLLGPLISSLGLLFVGLFMPILLQMQGTPTAQFVNLESTASMLTFAFAGGLTLVLTVPLIALIAAWKLSDAPTAAADDTVRRRLATKP